MKKPKFNIYFFGVLTLLALNSCSKSDEESPLNTEIQIKNKKSFTPGMVAGTLRTSKIYYENGQYKTSFGAGLNFGSSFTVPTNPYNIVNFSPWSPSFSAPSGSNLLSFQQDGNKFTAIYGTFTGGLIYNFSVKEYFKKLDAGIIPKVSDYVKKTTGDADGLIVVSGKFIIDHSTPLSVSIIEGSTVVPLQPGSIPTLLIGDIVKDGNSYFISIFENSDKLYELKALSLPDTHPKSVIWYDATYSKINSTSVLLQGEFGTKDGSRYVLNEIVNR